MPLADLLLADDTDFSEYYEAVDAADASDLAAVLHLAAHDDASVRQAAVSTLPLLTHGDPPTAEMIAVAIRLTTDPDASVRDYACFALAEQWREIDTPPLRAALAARLDDEHHDVRCDALVGLAHRLDERALPRVRAALSRPDGTVWRMELVAAGALSDPSLHDLVRQHLDGWDDEGSARTADLARRLTDPAGPGDDVLDGVADLCRRRAHDRPDGEALAAWHLMNDLLDIAGLEAELRDAPLKNTHSGHHPTFPPARASSRASYTVRMTVPFPSEQTR